jgi:hypothetical protein
MKKLFFSVVPAHGLLSNDLSIATLGVTAGKKIQMADFSIPISVAPTFNPLRKTGGIVLGVSFF